jgi:hypothetical protein
MLMVAMLKWWYTAGWGLMFARSSQRLNALGASFSVGTLLRTLFAPWKRIISFPGAGLDAHLRAMLDNLVSRAVGFVVRIFVLLAVGVLAILELLLGLVGIVLWPLLPVFVVVSLLKGLGVFG